MKNKKKYLVPDVYQNAVKIYKDDGSIDYLVSTHCHDFVSHQWEDGSSVYVDGGNEYIRRGWNLDDELQIDRVYYEEFSVTQNDSFEFLKEKFLWGTRGKDGNESFKWVRLQECNSSHLKAILRTQDQINLMTESVIKSILAERKYF
jgi:hypothetical protein